MEKSHEGKYNLIRRLKTAPALYVRHATFDGGGGHKEIQGVAAEQRVEEQDAITITLE